MKKFGRDKVALFLACASVLGSKTYAMDKNKAQNPQIAVEVRKKASSCSKEIPNWLKILVSVGGVALAVMAYNEIMGGIYGTNWYLGKYSIVNYLRQQSKHLDALLKKFEDASKDSQKSNEYFLKCKQFLIDIYTSVFKEQYNFITKDKGQIEKLKSIISFILEPNVAKNIKIRLHDYKKNQVYRFCIDEKEEFELLKGKNSAFLFFNNEKVLKIDLQGAVGEMHRYKRLN